MNIETFIDFQGTEHIIIRIDDETYTSMLKSAWEEIQAQAEKGGTL